MRSVALLLVVGATSCARIENTPPTSGTAPSATAAVTATATATATDAPAPAASAATVTTSSSAPSPLNGPCWTSLVRTADGGKPASEQKCAPGLACDYRDAVPDGPGRCRRR